MPNNTVGAVFGSCCALSRLRSADRGRCGRPAEGVIIVLAIAVISIAAGCATSSAKVTHFSGNTMGTTYQVTFVPAGVSIRQDEIEALLADINQSVSTYIETSVISRINASTDTAMWHPVDSHFYAVFRRARAIYDDTSGAFNPAVGPLVDAWGFGPVDSQALPDDETIHALLNVVSFDAFELQESPAMLRKQLAGAKLDFGGIAKGYGVDAIAELFEQRGVKDYIVNIAGEVRARGQRPEGGGWHVGIERPAENAVAAPKIQTVISLNNSAVSTSGTYRNYRTEDWKTFAHIINPKTGYPVRSNLVSVSVLAHDGMTADAYATALMVMGLDEAFQFVEARKELEAYFIARDPEGNLIEKFSSGFPIR
jgi:thiamine biosynthesis lipoprotein